MWCVCAGAWRLMEHGAKIEDISRLRYRRLKAQTLKSMLSSMASHLDSYVLMSAAHPPTYDHHIKHVYVYTYIHIYRPYSYTNLNLR